MKKAIFLAGIVVANAMNTLAVETELLSVKTIWGPKQSGEPHNAFTDMIRFQGKWYIGFREAIKHHGGLEGKGRLRVIRSDEGEAWESCGLFVIEEGDLRDAKLSITRTGELMLNTAIQVYHPNPDKHRNFAWFSKDGRTWSEPVQIGENNIWLWSVTWYDGVAYGVGYPTTENRSIRLYKSEDGRKWEVLVKDLYPRGNESSIAFEPDGTAYCLVRSGNVIGQAKAPYKEWTWSQSLNLGGPKMIRLKDGRFIAGGRVGWGSMRLYEVDPETGRSKHLIDLPARGDSSYPGLVLHEGVLWVSYYTSSDAATEGGRYLVPTEIRLAKVKFGDTSAFVAPATEALGE